MLNLKALKYILVSINEDVFFNFGAPIQIKTTVSSWVVSQKESNFKILTYRTEQISTARTG